MTTTTVSRTIEAPPAAVFDAVADIRNFSQVVDQITDVEFLSETQVGVGTRFRETRDMKGRQVSSELEVTEYEPPHHVRLVSDQGGTVWDTVFTVTPQGDHSELTMVMEARAYKLAARLFNPLIKGMVQKAIEADMDAVKQWCERSTPE